jgi:hypothetical protein
VGSSASSQQVTYHSIYSQPFHRDRSALLLLPPGPSATGNVYLLECVPLRPCTSLRFTPACYVC